MTAPLKDRHSDCKFKGLSMIRAGLDGPSTPVRVEPLKLPQIEPAPVKEPTPVEKPEEVPA
jgi:hypothetical protein